MESRIEELETILSGLSNRIQLLNSRNLDEISSHDINSSFDGMDHGDTAWMIFSTIIVFVMTMPGVALFYGGLVPSAKSFLAAGLQTLSITGIITVLWLVLGYSLSFGPNNADLGHPLFGDWSLVWFRSTELDTSHVLASTIPHSVFCFFQLTFAIITAALIPGSFTDRMKFKSFIIFIAMWHIFVYCPIAHALWHPSGFLFKLGVLDFAGGNVVHIASGISALIASVIVGKGFGKNDFRPHNVIITVVGGALLWGGWFGFNAGSACGASSRAGQALINTHICAATGGLSFALVQYFDKSILIRVIYPEKKRERKAIVSHKSTELGKGGDALKNIMRNVLLEEAKAHSSHGHHYFPRLKIEFGEPDRNSLVLAMICGVVAGLVAVTPAAGFVDTMGAFVLGVVVGPGCYYGCWIKSLVGIEDSLDAFGIHAIGGLIGGIGTGLFAREEVGGINGALYGNPDQLQIQLYGILFSFGWAGVGTFIILFILSKTIGVRASLNFNNVGRNRSTVAGSSSPVKRNTRGSMMGSIMGKISVNFTSGKFSNVDHSVDRSVDEYDSVHRDHHYVFTYGALGISLIHNSDNNSKNNNGNQTHSPHPSIVSPSPSLVLRGRLSSRSGGSSPVRKSVTKISVSPMTDLKMNDMRYEPDEKLSVITEHKDNIEPGTPDDNNSVSNHNNNNNNNNQRKSMSSEGGVQDGIIRYFPAMDEDRLNTNNKRKQSEIQPSQNLWSMKVHADYE